MNKLTEKLYQEIRRIPTVDAHEHLMTEQSHLNGTLDFYDLFRHYCFGDLAAAGASVQELALWADKSHSIMERWLSFKPFFNAIRTVAYARSAIIVINDLLEFEELNDYTCEAVSEALQNQNKPGLYNRILKEKCNIVACIQCWMLGNEYPDYFFHLAPSPEVVDIFSTDSINKLSEKYNLEINTLDGLLEVMSKAVTTWKDDPSVVGIKSAHAYSRSIDFKKRNKSDAESIFNSVLSGRELSPDVKFDLFHAGMPWFREIAVLAKYFPNVYLNMAWTHIINPIQARTALSEWLDMLPNNKIFGFGGDYQMVEKVYGHLQIARYNIARVLAEKISEGSYSFEDAIMVAKNLMFHNIVEFYRLNIST